MSLTNLRAAFDATPHHLAAFFVLGDPDLETSLALAKAAIDAGCTQLELGLPFSDPCGDGPAIQRAQSRALAAGVSTAAATELLAHIHAHSPATPLNLLVYGNLVHARGADAFCSSLAAAGASSLLTPDIPLPEAESIRAACAEHDLGFVPLVGPATTENRLEASNAAATGFLYLAGHQGVTGARAPESHSSDLVIHTAAQTDAPICLGFGLKDADSIRRAFRAGAKMAVVGSHLAIAIERGLEAESDPSNSADRTAQVVDSITNAISLLTQALQP